MPRKPNPDPTTLPLTARQHAVYEAIYACVRDHGYQPSVRELATHFGFASSNAVADHLAALVRKGWLAKVSGEVRALRLLRRLDGSPFVGFAEKE